MTKFTAKHLCQNLFFNKAESLQLYWKRGSGTDVFLWISRNFSEHLFDRTPPGDCFWREKIETCICIVEWYLVIRKTKTFPGLPNPLVLQSRLHGIFETFFQKTSTCLFIPAQKATNMVTMHKKSSFPLTISPKKSLMENFIFCAAIKSWTCWFFQYCPMLFPYWLVSPYNHIIYFFYHGHLKYIHGFTHWFFLWCVFVKKIMKKSLFNPFKTEAVII